MPRFSTASTGIRTHPVHQPKCDWYQAGGLLRPVQRLDFGFEEVRFGGVLTGFLACLEIFYLILEGVCEGVFSFSAFASLVFSFLASQPYDLRPFEDDFVVFCRPGS